MVSVADLEMSVVGAGLPLSRSTVAGAHMQLSPRVVLVSSVVSSEVTSP